MHNKISVVSGSGGGGGGKPHTPIEYDDTLSSKQKLRMLFVVSEGEIDSISKVDVNGSPIEGYQATYEIRTGTVDQTHIPGFAEVETPASPTVNAQLSHGFPITREVSTNAVDAVRVTLRINSLFKVQENGDTVGHTVQIAIRTRKDNADIWTTRKTVTKTDKGTSPYKMDVRIERPFNAVDSTWQVQVERLSIDDLDSKFSSATFFDNYTEIQDVTLTYPHSALVGVAFHNADELGGSIPSLAFFGKWRKISVPVETVYNSTDRTYITTTWNGAFALAKVSTSCVAWHLYDVLTDERAGRGIPSGEINIFSFFDFAIECDGLVDDGNGAGTFEHRHSINNQFYRRENASTFINFLLALGNCRLANDEFGLISVISDKPTQATKIVNNSNVIDGAFDYPGSELDETFSWVNVTYNDPNDKHNTTTVFEKRQDRIDLFGLIKADVVLVGCTSEAQARRKAKWVLYGPDGSVSFKVGLEGMVYRIGEVIEVMDDLFKNVFQQGRIKSASSDASFTTIILDREIIFGNESYSVLCYGADAIEVYEAPIIEQNITTNIITVNAPGPLATDPNTNSLFIIRGDIEPSLFKVASIEVDEGIYTVLAPKYDPLKYAIIEGGLVNRTPSKPFINTDGFTVEPVENIQFHEIFGSSDASKISRIGVIWDWDLDQSDELIATYQYTWRRDSIQFSAIQTTALKEFEIPDVTPGVYEVVITAYNPRGIRSVPVSQIYNFRTTAAQSTLRPPITFHVINTLSNVFETRDLSVSWFYDPTNDDRELVNDSLSDYVIEIWSAGILKNSYVEKPTTDKNGVFTYTFQDNENDHGGTASRSIEIRLYSRDIVGDVSLSIQETFTNPVPPVVSFTLLAGTGAAYINITPPSDPDIAGYLVYRDTSGIDFVPNAGNLQYDDVGNYIALGVSAGTYYYKVAAYDSFGKTALNVSGGSGSTTLGADVDKFAFTGLGFTPNDPVVNSVSWLAGTVSINGAAPVAIAAGNAAWTAGTLYLYFDKATTSIGATNDITIAVQKAIILAAYSGGTDLKSGDGTAFFNGSQVLAQSIGANQLVTNTAVITETAQIAGAIIKEAHIDTGQINNAHIKDVISSTNYNNITATGWELNKDGDFTTYGNVNLFSPFSEVTLQDIFRDIVFSLIGNATIFGRTVTKPTGVGAWDTKAYSDTGLLSPMRFRFYRPTLVGISAAGLTESSTGQLDPALIEYSFYIDASEVITIRELGVIVYTHSSPHTIDNLYEIIYSGSTVTYFINGSLVFTTVGAAAKTYYLTEALFTVGTKYTKSNLQSEVSDQLPTGARMEVTGEGISVYDNNNILRVRLGNLFE